MSAPDDYDHGPDIDDYCPNCGGEGVYYCCVDEIGCVDPENGCDLCERECDWCKPNKVRNTGDELGQVLAEALTSTDSEGTK